eukprot:4830070-Pyramimonas_sp.AAC.1
MTLSMGRAVVFYGSEGVTAKAAAVEANEVHKGHPQGMRANAPLSAAPLAVDIQKARSCTEGVQDRERPAAGPDCLEGG